MDKMIRHTWQGRSAMPQVTVLICQRKTPDAIRLCLESLLQWYPDVDVLVVDGDSQDEGSTYLAMKQALYPNVRVHTFRSDRHSHGEIMDMAIRTLITSDYVVLMDSDVVTMRGGWIEPMLFMGAYAIGTGMNVGIKAEGCGPAQGPEDEVLYIHPSLAMIHREKYLTMAPFKDHGAPCISNMIDAKERGYKVVDFPVENYTLHLSGSSWTAPRTVWWHDNNVMIRPMLTIVNPTSFVGYHNDVEVVYIGGGNRVWQSIITWDMVEYQGYDPGLLMGRFNVRGEYVKVGGGTEHIDEFRQQVIEYKGPRALDIHGKTYLQRHEFQRSIVTKKWDITIPIRRP